MAGFALNMDYPIAANWPASASIGSVYNQMRGRFLLPIFLKRREEPARNSASVYAASVSSCR
jgi:hypothetical protein